MKHRVVINVGEKIFEFIGYMKEFGEDSIIIRTASGEVYVERRYLVFVEFLDEKEVKPPSKPSITQVSSAKRDAAKLINQRLKQDPLNERLKEKLIPPSQLPDDENEWEHIDGEPDDLEMPDFIDEDVETMKNVIASNVGQEHPFVKATNLKQAAQMAMGGDNDNFSMGGVNYKSPLQTVVGMKNVKSKKTNID